MLEILTGLPVIEEDKTYIIERVDNEMDIHNNVLKLVDQRANLWDEKSVKMMYDLSTQCTEQKPRRRPDIDEVSILPALATFVNEITNVIDLQINKNELLYLYSYVHDI